METETGRRFTVQVEASYLHLGGMLSRDADMTHEARSKISIAAASYSASSKQLLQNKHIERSSRSMLFSSLVTSTFHNLELWTTQEAAWDIVLKGYGRLTRKLLAAKFTGQLITSCRRKKCGTSLSSSLLGYGRGSGA